MDHPQTIQLTPGQSPISRFFLRVMLVTVMLAVLVFAAVIAVFVVLPMVVVAAVIVGFTMGWQKLKRLFGGSPSRGGGRRNVRVVDRTNDL